MSYINGCNNGSYSRSSRKCRKCCNNEYCSSRNKEPITYIRDLDIERVSKLANIGISLEEATEQLATVIAANIVTINEI